MDADAPLLSSGLTSIHALQLSMRLQKAAGEGAPALPSMLVFQYPTARKIADSFTMKAPAKSKPSGLDVSSVVSLIEKVARAPPRWARTPAAVAAPPAVACTC